MKFLFAFLCFALISSRARSSLLDDDDHHHDHDDHHDHIEDQLEDHFDRDSDEDSHNALFVNQLGGFLPSKEPVRHTVRARGKQLDFPDFSPPPSATRDFDLGQFSFREPEPVSHQGPIVFPDFSPPKHSSVLIDVGDDYVEELLPGIQVIDNFDDDFSDNRAVEVFPHYDDDDSSEFALLPAHDVALSPAPHSVDPEPKHIPEVTDNFIGGQGRQLGIGGFDSGSSEEAIYPQYAFVPQTSFSCAAQSYGGYFADPETNCQVFHICLNGGLMGSFLCPNQTLFNQQFLVCDWWFNVDCASSLQAYELNTRIGTDQHFLL